jgi:hypothetical protein
LLPDLVLESRPNVTDDRDSGRDVWEEYRRGGARDDMSRGMGQGFGFGVGCVVAVIGIFAVGSLLLILVFAIGFGGGPSLGSLHDDCANGDMPACDRLFLESPIFPRPAGPVRAAIPVNGASPRSVARSRRTRE